MYAIRSYYDDYITKPFSMEELLMRIKVFLKRSTPASDESNEMQNCKVGRYDFYFDNLTLQNGEKKRTLTYKEAELLKFFCENPNKVRITSYNVCYTKLLRIIVSRVFTRGIPFLSKMIPRGAGMFIILKNRGIYSEAYVYEKYKIDSLTFAESNNYYA